MGVPKEEMIFKQSFFNNFWDNFIIYIYFMFLHFFLYFLVFVSMSYFLCKILVVLTVVMYKCSNNTILLKEMLMNASSTFFKHYK